MRGYELEKGRYVQVTEDELEALEAEANSNIELKEFVLIKKVDPVYFESTYYLAPDQGGEKAYRLLSDAMEKTGRVALAEMVWHDKEALVLIPSTRRRARAADDVLRQRDPGFRSDRQRRKS